MTTTDMTTPIPPTTPPPTRRLRRSRTDRIGAGVAGGLGEYFGIDPVIFRVLFATAAFFGGAGVLAYLLAWAAIPEEGTEHAAIDGWVSSLRNRRVPVWLIVVAAALLLWLVAFSWWAPGPFFPVLAVVIILVVVFGRRGRSDAPPVPPDTASAAPGAPVDPTVNLSKDRPAPPPPAWAGEARQWVAESRSAHRERVRRAFPVKVATLLVLGATLLTLGLIDAATGIALPLYFWFALAILAAGMIVGMVLRRTPWSLTVLLVPAIAGVIAFAGSHSSLHDGVGERTWAPKQNLASSYDLSLGQSTLDLTKLAPQDGPRTVHIEQAAGQVHIIAPKTMNLTVLANVHFGVVTVDGQADQSGGVAVSRLVEPPAGSTGAPITVDVHLADGQVTIDRQP
jgi:phage shock protein PspC (stress-responsive transcriptional regulator)/FtsH-binding integral membrane protein